MFLHSKYPLQVLLLLLLSLVSGEALYTTSIDPKKSNSQTLLFFQENIGSFRIRGGKPNATFFTSKDVELLPVGTSTGSILEYWYLGSIVNNADKGGFATTEPLVVNTHGGSALWQKYWFENMDISHPLSRGKPFIDLPLKSWNFFSIHSFLGNYSNFSGYHWKLFSLDSDVVRVTNDKKHSIKTNIALTSLMGGESLTARGLFDREPVQLWGAPKERRHFLPSYEGSVHYEGPGLLLKPMIAFIEVLSHNRSFPTIGEQIENNYRVSSVIAQKLDEQHNFFFLYQGRAQEYVGVEKMQSLNNSLKEYEHNVVLNLNANIPQSGQRNYHIGLGFGLGDQEARQNNIAFSIQDEIIHGTPVLPRTHRVFFIDGAAQQKHLLYWKNFLQTSIGFSGQLRFELTSQQHDLEDIKIIRYDENIPLDVLFHEKSSNQIDMLFRLKPKIFAVSTLGFLELQTEFGALSENIFSDLNSGFYRISPNALIRLIYPIAHYRIEFFFGLQHESIPSTLQESEFLNQRSVGSRRERWIDTNKDRRFQQGEEAGVLQRSGGARHKIDPNIKHPVLEEIFIGGEFSFGEAWLTSLNLSGKLHRNLYWVCYADDFQSGYREITRSGIKGGKLYDREPGSYGQERYVLTNRDTNSFFVGIDFQILKEAISSWWFINIAVGIYTHLASNLVGNGVENNDIARYSELTTDPNRNLNLFARTDYDRGYVANILFGFYLWEGLTWTNTIHYRDGIPFGDFVTVRGLSQGSLPIMHKERGGGLSGVGRYTFYLNWDMRIHYKHNHYSITFDIYNLLESSTEILEDPFVNRSRRPLDSTTPRSFRLIFSYRWDAYANL